MKSLQISFLFILITCLHSPVHSHPGGHYRTGDGSQFNTWRLSNGQQIKGNFYAYHQNKIILEWVNGQLFTLSIDAFSDQDQLLLKRKISRIQGINAQPLPLLPENISQFTFNPVPLIILTGVILIFLWFWRRYKNRYLYQSLYFKPAVLSALTAVVILSCQKTSNQSGTSNNSGNTTVVIPKTNTTFLDSVFSPFQPNITTRFDNTYYYVSSNGLPQHNMMIGITNWQQQVPIPQTYTGSNSWSIPLQPIMASIPLSTKSNLMKGAVAVAINGIPIFNALNNRGEDSYLIGELDNWGGHCGKADDYHYHAAPLHLAAVSNNLPIAYALDGFPVYASKEPDGTTMTSLDTCHGHIWNTNYYHYHGTSTYPYVVGAMKGKVTLDPNTPAPENQILPQAFAKPARPSTNPLNGASITNFFSTGSNAYLLTYKIGSKNGYVAYSWNANNLFTYSLTDTSGQTVTNSYQR